MLFWNGRWQMGGNTLHLRGHCTPTFTELNPSVSLHQLQGPSSVMLLTCLPAPWKLSDAPCLSMLNNFLKVGVAPLFFQGFPLQLFFSEQRKTNFEQTSTTHISLLQSWATLTQMELSFHLPFPMPTPLLPTVPACVMKSKCSVLLLPIWADQFVDCATHTKLKWCYQAYMFSLLTFSDLC